MRSPLAIATLVGGRVKRAPGTSLLLGAAVVLHLVLVVSIARQPMEPSLAGAARPWIWPLHNDTVHRRGPAADFFALYTAGRWVRKDRSPYTQEPMPEAPPSYAYRYLPVLASTVGAPLSRLAPRTAWWGWIALLELLLAASIAQLAWMSRRRVAVWSTLLLLLSSPYFLELHMGQFTFATCALAMLAAAWTEAGRSRASALGAVVALAAAALLKVFPLVTLPALAKSARGAVVGCLAVLVFVAAALPAFVLQPEDWESFRNANFAASAGGMNAGNYGLLQLLHLLGARGGGWQADAWQQLALLWQALLLSGTAGLVLVARHSSLTLGAATLLLAHFLSYVHVWEHHMSGALLAVLAAAVVAEREGGGRPQLLLLGAACLLALPTPFGLFDHALDPRVWDPSVAWPLWQRMLLAASKALPLALAFGTCLALLLRRGIGAPRLLEPMGGRASQEANSRVAAIDPPEGRG